MGKLDKNPSQNRRIIMFISLLSLIVFLIIFFLKSSFATTDANINSWSVSIRSATLTQIAKIIHYGFDTTSLFIISLLIAAYLFYKKYKDDAFLLAGAMLTDVVIIEAVKMLVHFPRPLNGIVNESGFSFPSGHVASTVVLFGLLTYFVWKHWKSPNAKVLSSLFFVAIAIVVGFDRIYLNVHWFSDVLGSYPLGIFLLAFSILAFQCINFKKYLPNDFENLRFC
jgi:undecaprenyl-diphosphatase